MMKKNYRFAILLILFILLFIISTSCSSENKSNKYKEIVDQFFSLLQSSQFENAKMLLDDIEVERALKFDFGTIENNGIANIYLSSIDYKIIEVGNQEISVEITLIDEEFLIKKSLDDITMEGFRGSVLSGFQNAVAKSFEIFAENMSDVNANKKTNDVTLRFVERNDEILIVQDDELFNSLILPIENIISILEILAE